MIITRRAHYGSTYRNAGTTVSYCMLRPCTLTGTLRPRLSLSLSILWLLFFSPRNFSFRVYVRVAIGVLAAARSTGVEWASATSGIAPSPRLARAETRAATKVTLLSHARLRDAKVCFRPSVIIIGLSRSDCIGGVELIIDNNRTEVA